MATLDSAKRFTVLCHEHHAEMTQTQVLAQTEGQPRQTSLYSCSCQDCAVRYNLSSGYFIATENGEPEFDTMPRIRCSRDGQPMYLAEVSPEKREFRLWRCPQCDASRTNEEGLVNEPPSLQA